MVFPHIRLCLLIRERAQVIHDKMEKNYQMFKVRYKELKEQGQFLLRIYNPPTLNCPLDCPCP